MRFSNFRLLHYKCFLDSGDMALGPGINIIIGQNNAGKSALLEAMSLKFADRPHVSLETVPNPRQPTRATSKARVGLVVSQLEFNEMLEGNPHFYFAFEEGHGGQIQVARSQFDKLRAMTELEVQVEVMPNGMVAAREPSFGLYEGEQNSTPCYFVQDRDGNYELTTGNDNRTRNAPEIGVLLASSLANRIYSFKAERLNVGECSVGISTDLSPTASNLPEVLSVLQANRVKFEKYNALIRRVLPQVHCVTVRPVSGSKVEILVWGGDTDRQDLAFSLANSGTGIGQVLAMLYVIVTATFPRVIIIDEPNSFLHPGATRALFEIFKEHPEHQYIISTHSAEALTAGEPATITLLQKRGSKTQADQLQASSAKDVRLLLREIGARLSDVFGADRILWVEGPSDEECFKRIVQRLLKKPLTGTAILGVVHTGDFDADKSGLVVKVYERLSRSSALLPLPAGFIFDRELRSEQDIKDLERRSGGLVSFLARRTLENYLIHSGAIAHVLALECAQCGCPLPPLDKVDGWLKGNRDRDEFFVKAPREPWELHVDAPKLLKALFQDVTESAFEYRKIRHSPMLADWLIENEPERLRDLSDLIEQKLFSKG